MQYITRAMARGCVVHARAAWHIVESRRLLMKRILCLLLIAVMLIPLFTACSKGTKLTLFDGDVCEIAYDKNTANREDVKKLGKAITDAVGIEVKIVEVPSEETEIFVGLVDHEDAKLATADLRQNDYILGVFGEHYVIASPVPSYTKRAIAYFTENVLAGADGKLKLRSADNYRLDGKYMLEGVKIGGLTLDRHSIVIPTNYSISELRTAVTLQQWLKSMAGYDLALMTIDKATSEGQIRIGASICERAKAAAEHSYAITGNGTNLEIAAASYLGYEGVQDVLLEQVFIAGLPSCVLDETTDIRGNNRDGASAPLASQGDVRIMFSNMYGGHQPEHPFAQRGAQLAELYFTYMPDVLGLQEMNPSNGSGELLDALLSQYYTEAGELTGTELTTRKNYTPLYYNADRLEVVKAADGSEYAGNYRFDIDLNYDDYSLALRNGYSGAALKDKAKDVSKGFNWAIFRIKGTDHVFLVASVHLWFRTEDRRDSGARKVQMQAMKEVLATAAATFAAEQGLSADTIPIYVGGDYNTSVSGDQLSTMETETELSVQIAGQNVTIDTTFAHANTLEGEYAKMEKSSFHAHETYMNNLGIKGNVAEEYDGGELGFGIYGNPVMPGNDWSASIDHIFTNKAAVDGNMVKMHQYGSLTDDYALLSSDHCPVFVDISFTANAPVLN